MSLNTCGRKVVLAGSYLSDLNTQPVRVQHGRVTLNQDVTYIVRNNLLCVFFSRILLGKANVKGIFFLTLHFYFADSQADGVSDGVGCQLEGPHSACRTAAGNIFRRAQRSLPSGRHIPLRFQSGV